MSDRHSTPADVISARGATVTARDPDAMMLLLVPDAI